MQTRKSLKDKQGYKTFYVIETLVYDQWMACDGWVFRFYDDAVKKKKELIKSEIEFKKEYRTITQYSYDPAKFRIRLYVRAD